MEITRVATNGHRNANSMIYGALCRAAKALGYKKAITYTLDSESGASLRATNWVEEARTPGATDWNTPNSERFRQPLLFGERYPQHDGEKIRWVKDL